MWYVIYTKPKAEKKVAEGLEKLSVEVYCPLITQVRQWSDRKKKVTVPLFTSYVFVKLREKERQKVFQIPGVLKYLYWLGRPAVVREAEIETIRKWLNEEEVENVQVENLSPGDKVLIKSGVLKDQEAIIREAGPKRVRLILVKLGCTVSVRTRDIITHTV